MANKNKARKESKTKKGEFKRSRSYNKQKQRLYDAVKMVNDPKHADDVYVNIDKLRVKLIPFDPCRMLDYHSLYTGFIGIAKFSKTFHLCHVFCAEHPRTYEYGFVSQTLDFKSQSWDRKIYAIAERAYARPKFGEESKINKQIFDQLNSVDDILALSV